MQKNVHLVLQDKINNKKISFNNENINIYLCGPTVYSDVHIGNIRPVIVFDVLIRYLRQINQKYQYVHNITDIDDKIINRAIEERVSEREISEKYTSRYLEILKTLNVITDVQEHKIVKVTDSIECIKSDIQDLISVGSAYEKDGSVWFDISKFEDVYSEISKQNLDQLKTDKSSDFNFALWKKTDAGIVWDSPWGNGRPGWHIECFCFIKNIFKSPVDIHGGGVDLKFPHHANENIISHALFHTGLSQLWLHIGHVGIKNQKISKSSENSTSFLVKDLIKEYGSNSIRKWLLMSPYKKPMEFDGPSEHPSKSWSSWVNLINVINMTIIQEFIDSGEIHHPRTEISDEFLSHIANDLNTPNAMDWIEQRISKLKKASKQIDANNKWESWLLMGQNKLNIEQLSSELITHLEWLGFTFNNIYDSVPALKLMNKWRGFIKSGSSTEADQLSDQLSTDHGIYVPKFSVWHSTKTNI